ncbi:alpha/beta fold hydrolase [uncultured Flavobacterium sp.]|uniref:alpha/beta fold hydrolase n=1 Tax=uncultured Flavobacterium sp. TaxID=165435 RepID=UPI0030CA148F
MKNSFHFLLTKSIGLYINLLSFVFPKKAGHIAHAFYSEPRKGKLSKKKLPKILQESHSETFQYEEDCIQSYTWKGNKTVILLVHGWESNSSRWENLLPYLKKSGSTIIAIDGPAQGLSSGKEFTILKYAEFIHLIVEKFKPQYLIGHSMGGQTCLYYQYKYQSPSIEKMVILGAPSDFKILFNNFISLLSLNTRISKTLEKKYIKILNRNLEQFSGKLFASKIDVKGLVAHDIDDKVVLFEEAKKIVGAWKDVQFIETSGLGHKLHDDDLYKKVSLFLFD